MSEILIKNMEMPKNCKECPCSTWALDEPFFFCVLGQEVSCEYDTRGNGCPLVEVNEGVWLYYGNGVYECSECHEQYILDDTPTAHKYHFCPNCGSRMEVEHGLAY